MRFLVGPALRAVEKTQPGVRVIVVERYGEPALADLRRDDLDIVLTEYDTACDHALRRIARAAGIEPEACDVCVEFPSVLALVSAGRGAAIVPASTLTDEPVAVCPVPDLGGRHIAALCRTSPSPAVQTALRALSG
jgi:DNA-binding transcriptional LysR family regulator